MIKGTLHFNGCMVDFTSITRSEINQFNSYIYRVSKNGVTVASMVTSEIIKLKKIKGVNSWYNLNCKGV